MSEAIRPVVVLDTGALLGYASGDLKIGQLLLDLLATGSVAGIPDLCTMEAFSRLHHDEFALLDVLLTHPVIQPCPASVAANLPDLGFIGGMTRTTGRLGAGHAAWVAMITQAEVWTSHPDQIRAALGKEWPITEV